MNEFPEAEDWGGTCAAGRRQSPVDLNENASVRGEYNPFKFVKYGHRATQSYSILNNGHSSK